MRWGSKIKNSWLIVIVLLGLAPWAVAAEPRDPFMFGPREGEAGGGGQLTGILWDATNPLGVHGGEPLGGGAVVEGWMVMAIAPDQVVIERDGHRETLVPGSVIPSE